jgi:CRISPR-associated protein Cas2
MSRRLKVRAQRTNASVRQAELVVVAYDIANANRLRRAARLCEAYGQRVQLSVYEMHLQAGDLAALQAGLREILDPRVDHVRYYRICASDQADAKHLGTAIPTQPHAYTVV